MFAIRVGRFIKKDEVWIGNKYIHTHTYIYIHRKWSRGHRHRKFFCFLISLFHIWVSSFMFSFGAGGSTYVCMYVSMHVCLCLI